MDLLKAQATFRPWNKLVCHFSGIRELPQRPVNSDEWEWGTVQSTSTERELKPIKQMPPGILTQCLGSTSMMTMKWKWQHPGRTPAGKGLNTWLLMFPSCYMSIVEIKHHRTAKKMVLGPSEGQYCTKLKKLKQFITQTLIHLRSC